MSYLLDSNFSRLKDSAGNYLYDSDGPPLGTSPKDWTSSKVPKLASGALRKLGVTIVANGDRQADGPTLKIEDIVDRVVYALGIPVAAKDRSKPLGVVNDAEVAKRALRSLGVNPIAALTVAGTVTRAEIAKRALVTFQVNVADLPAEGTGKTWTYQQIGVEALRRLSVIDSREAPSAEDTLESETHAQAMHDMLAGLDYVDWTADAIPNSVVEAYIALTANIMAPHFGRTSQSDIGAAAQDMVRRQALSGQVAQDRTVARVQAVHESLVAEGLADWGADAVPEAVADAYVMMVAAAVAPIYGKPMDGQATAAAVAQIRRVVLSGPRGQQLAVDKVRSADDSLASTGVVSWPVTAIPIAFADDYAALASSMLAPMYGQKSEDVWPTVREKLRLAADVKQKEQRAGEKVRSVYDELNAMGVITWDYDHVPGYMADAIVSMAVALMRGDEGKLDPAAVANGYQRVRQIAMRGPLGQALAEQKVRAVHYDLEARGKTRWTLVDIPRWAEEPYEFLAAALLAPEFEIKADPTWGIMAEMSLARATALPSTRQPVRGVYF